MSGGVWLQKFVPRPEARLRLICFHHAGAGAAVYRTWGRGLPAAIEVVAVQLPGRANRLKEPAIESVGGMVDGLLPELRAQLDRPYALFGHSMGAVIAAEVAAALLRDGAPAPQHLFLSGRRPPQLPDPRPPLRDLDDAAFVAEINRRYGGIPPELMQHADVLALLLPSLRADIRALETHQGGPVVPLPCPITALGGTEDGLTSHEHLLAWRDHTQAAFRVRQFPGDHFYLDPRRDEVLAEITAALAPRWAEESAA